MTTKDDTFLALIGGLLGEIARENIDAYAAIGQSPAGKSALEAVEAGNIENFYFGFVRPFNQVVDGLLAKALPHATRAHFLFRCSSFVESHLCNAFVRAEGRACSTDKARTVMRALLRFIVTGKPVAFDYGQQYTYHLPQRILRSHDDIVAFYDALETLYYGNPAPYVKMLAHFQKDELRDPAEAA